MVTVLALMLYITFVIIITILWQRNSFKTCPSNMRMEGKVVIITGANAGLGFHLAKNLAARGARIILACRSETRGKAARDSIITQTGNEDVVFRKLDLSSLESIRTFAANVKATEHQLHVLVNNAGIYGFTEHTNDGIVEDLQVNYLGHFLLTLLLLPLLKKSQPSRIINLSSILHFFGRFNPDSFDKKPLWTLFNYCNSKFYMLVFSVELSRKLAGTGVAANAVHPGVILTGIASQGSRISYFLFWCWCLIYNRTVEQGAQTIEYLAVAEECAGVSGKYFVDCASRVMQWGAKSETVARQLWETSVKLVGYQDIDFVKTD